MDKKQIALLLESIIQLENTNEAFVFLQDLCTIKEIEDMQHRLEIAQGLYEGKTFSEVQVETGASSTTVSRVSRCLKYGEGYNTILKKRNAK
ncbi:MAG TPA: DNA-binding transcriptional regulator [Eubacteriaceae bacterium]|nr:DNA-binding transcriptional regulator [Eubacteriaceae bacterium]